MISHGPSRSHRHPRGSAPCHPAWQWWRAHFLRRRRLCALPRSPGATLPRGRRRSVGMVPDAQPCASRPGAVRCRRVAPRARPGTPPLCRRHSRAAQARRPFLAGSFRRCRHGRGSSGGGRARARILPARTTGSRRARPFASASRALPTCSPPNRTPKRFRGCARPRASAGRWGTTASSPGSSGPPRAASNPASEDQNHGREPTRKRRISNGTLSALRHRELNALSP